MNPTQDVVKHWLREQLLPLVNVQRCAFTGTSVAGGPARDPDLIVLTWAGVMIYLHLIDEPTKAPKVRRILENTTGAGIAVLFILDSALLPHPSQKVEGGKWYEIFSHLAHDRIYTYTVGATGTVIRPARFVPAGRAQIEIQYGAPIAIQHLRHLRYTVKQNALKGYWLLADFETELSAKNQTFRRVEETPHRAASHAEPRSNGSAASLPSQPITRLDQCYALLGIPREASREEIRAAFRKLAFEVHPDVSHLPKAEAEARFKAVSEAYEYIKTAQSWP